MFLGLFKQDSGIKASEVLKLIDSCGKDLLTFTNPAK